MAGMVQLELDDKDKESFNEMRQSMGQAQQELSMVQRKQQIRVQEQRQAELTLAELQGMSDDTVAYHQVGKMFLQNPMVDLKEKLSTKVEGCKKEVEGLKGKEEHVKKAAEKVTEDFNEFIKAHLVSREEGEAEGK